MTDDLHRVAEGTRDPAIARLATELSHIAEDVREIRAVIRGDLIGRADHVALEARTQRLERAVYGVAGLIVLTVIGALVALVVGG